MKRNAPREILRWTRGSYKYKGSPENWEFVLSAEQTHTSHLEAELVKDLNNELVNK